MTSIREIAEINHGYYLGDTPDSASQPGVDIGKFYFTALGLTARHLRESDAIVVTKSVSGFDAKSVSELSTFLDAVARGQFPELKYLVFRFAHVEERGGRQEVEGFEELITALAELILEVPVITIAWASAEVTAADLDFSLYCAHLVAEPNARFSFDGDPSVLFGLYAAVARRVGLVKTERLIEAGGFLSSEDMRELNLVREIVSERSDFAAIVNHIDQQKRRYNSAAAIAKAQTIAMAPINRGSRRTS